MKRFVALARVSSREQEREGFSLDVQVDALERYADSNSGRIVQLFRIAETASKADERTTFRELVRFAKKNASKLDGILFYKVDRAARNLFDYVELERLESEFGVPFISVSQPMENSPSGRMMRRTLANMAAFYTEQQSLDVQEGLTRRALSGLFIGKAPYGYKNVRKEGRGLIEVDPINGPKVQRIFELYAYRGHTIESLIDQLSGEAIQYRPSTPCFPKSSVHNILRDRAYIGEVEHRGKWHPGIQEPLIDRITWDRVQALLVRGSYRSHELTYASGLITCCHCGHSITGEIKLKPSKSGTKAYSYYRCAKYNGPGHPRHRLSESDLDQQILTVFNELRIDDDELRSWFAQVLRAKTKSQQVETGERLGDLNRQLASVHRQQDQLLNLRLNEEIDQNRFAQKQMELRDREATIAAQIRELSYARHSNADIALKAFELSQSLREKWVTADFNAKRRILEILFLNLKLDGVSLFPEMRKPFDILVERPILKLSRGDCRFTLLHENEGLELALSLFPQAIEFEGDAVLQHVKLGLYSKKR